MHRNAGGAEVYTDRVAKEWVKQGHEVTLFASSVEGRPEFDVAPGGYAIVRRGTRHGVYREARRYWRSEGRGNFDLVVDEVNTRPFGCSRFVRGTPVVALIHQVCKEIWDYETTWPLSIIGRRVLEPRWLSWYRNVPVVTVSESSRESLEGYGLKQISVLPEGYDESSGGTVGSGKETNPTLVFVGRLTANKRPADALEVHRLLSRKHKNLQLWVIGGGPEEERLRRFAGDGVTFFGRCEDNVKQALLGRAHILLVTSVREGWGLVVTEAASNGTVACGYDVAGLRDSITASGGMLSDASPASLAEITGEMLRRVASGVSRPQVGGVASWAEVAGGILSVAAEQGVVRSKIVDRTGRWIATRSIDEGSGGPVPEVLS